ncbi:hypothetical protein VTN00DRAFT_9992 [Thermoascus crustaceus]|uniref:uncharacterized protein n=1 Tax=Thermoascus crustaceus TaxID=5088 RepID=UPI0037449634
MNMKGMGEEYPDWEFDFFEGEDVIAEVMEGPDPGERMELELFTRLGSGEQFSYDSDSDS